MFIFIIQATCLPPISTTLLNQSLYSRAKLVRSAAVAPKTSRFIEFRPRKSTNLEVTLAFSCIFHNYGGFLK